MEKQEGQVTEVENQQAGGEGAPETPTPAPQEQEKPREPLNVGNIADRARQALEKAGKKQGTAQTPPPGQPARGADGKFLSKAGEKAPEAAQKAGQGEGKGDPAPGAGQGGEEATPPAAQAFTPNPKFNALGKEYELPKWLADSIKSPEHENEMKELYTKAMGLDHVKMRHQELYGKHEQLTTDHNDLVDGIMEIRGIYADAVQSGNLLRLDDFFQKMQIPDQVILQYALQKVQYQELPPEQRVVIDQALASQRRAYDLDKQNQSLSNGASSAESKALAAQMDIALAKPDVSAIVQAFDSQPGRKPGAFREIVRQHGEYKWYASKGQIVLPPEQAIQEVISQLGLGAPQGNPAPAAVPAAAPAPAAQPAPQGAAPAQAPAAPAPHRNVPTIPAISGRAGASPMKQKPRSIADLKKIGQDMANSG